MMERVLGPIPTHLLQKTRCVLYLNSLTESCDKGGHFWLYICAQEATICSSVQVGLGCAQLFWKICQKTLQAPEGECSGHQWDRGGLLYHLL